MNEHKGPIVKELLIVPYEILHCKPQVHILFSLLALDSLPRYSSLWKGIGGRLF